MASEGNRSRSSGFDPCTPVGWRWVAHGPQPRDYSQRTPKKMIAAARQSPLHAARSRAHCPGLRGWRQASTKATSFLDVTDGRSKSLVVVDRNDENSILSLRNAPKRIIFADQLNAYDVLVSDDIVFTEAAYVAWFRRRRSD